MKQCSRVFVYRNLHYRDRVMYSVRNESTKRVQAHMDYIYLTDAVFRVGKAGREKVLQEKRKNVHAGVRGILTPLSKTLDLQDDFVQVRYNPYETETFVRCDTGEPVRQAKNVIINKKGVWRSGMSKV